MLFACRGRHEEVPVAMRPREIPVPIPNTMVKPRAADGTTPWGVGEQVAAGAPFKRGLRHTEETGLMEPRRGAPHGGVAQLGEHLPCKQGVKGSIPSISIMGL